MARPIINLDVMKWTKEYASFTNEYIELLPEYIKIINRGKMMRNILL